MVSQSNLCTVYNFLQKDNHELKMFEPDIRFFIFIHQTKVPSCKFRSMYYFIDQGPNYLVCYIFPFSDQVRQDLDYIYKSQLNFFQLFNQTRFSIFLFQFLTALFHSFLQHLLALKGHFLEFFQLDLELCQIFHCQWNYSLSLFGLQLMRWNNIILFSRKNKAIKLLQINLRGATEKIHFNIDFLSIIGSYMTLVFQFSFLELHGTFNFQ